VRVADITFFGLLIALTVAGGFALYLAGRWLPVPGSKFLVMAPYAGLITYVALARLPSPWTVTLFSAGFAVVMSTVSPLMGLAILAAGLATDLSRRLIPLGGAKLRRHLHAGLYPMYCFVLALLVVERLTEQALFGAIGAAPLVAGSTISYALGLGGGFVGARLVGRLAERRRSPDTDERET